MTSARPRVRAFIRVFERSSSLAAHVDTDAGEYVIKVRNNPEGPRVLVNEWIGTFLARHLSVPTPDFAIVEVPALVEIPLRSGLRAEPGPAFGSRFERSQPWAGESSLRAIANPDAMSKLVAFDTLLLNIDRYSLGDDNRTRENRHNLLMSAEGAPEGRLLLKAIDQGHCFGGTSWRARGLGAIERVRDRRVYGLFPEFRDHIEPLTTRAVIADAAAIEPKTLRAIIRDIPRDWGLSRQDAEAIEPFLRDRASYLLQELPAMLSPQGTLGGGEWQ